MWLITTICTDCKHHKEIELVIKTFPKLKYLIQIVLYVSFIKHSRNKDFDSTQKIVDNTKWKKRKYLPHIILEKLS